MPPLSDTLYEESRSKLEHIEKRLNDAESFQIPRLRNHVGALALQQQYAAELREDLESCRRELHILETFVDDIVSALRRKEINDQLDTLIPRVDELKKEFRAALLASKRNIDAQAPSYREELLRSSTLQSEEQSRGLRGNNSDDAVMHASEAVTEALRRTTQLMQQELERSVLSTQMLDESTRGMSATSDLYATFGSLLTTSKNLVTALEKSDWLDRLLILSSLAFFLLVVAYIIKKRVIDKGIWLAFWWVRYIPFPTSRPLPSTTATATTIASPPQGSLSQTEELVVAASSLVASSLVAAPLTLSNSRSSLAEEISSLASAAFEFKHPEPTDVSILAESIIDDVLAQAEATRALDITLDAGSGEADEKADRSPLAEKTGADADALGGNSPLATPPLTEYIHQEL